MNELCSLADNPTPLRFMDVADPAPAEHALLLQVAVCGVCHTELDIIEGRTPPPRLPLIPGHQVIGRVVERGKNTTTFAEGDRVGVPWIFSACGTCPFCRSGRENLCPEFTATGRDADGGYAQYMTIPESFAVPIPDCFDDASAAPLLCAGAIGYRSLRLTELRDGQNLGLTGFGASAHLVLQMVRHRYPATDVFVFARGAEQRAFATELGAVWTGDTADRPPVQLDGIIDTTPAWYPVVEALKNLAPGGRLVINAIGKEDQDKSALLALQYPRDLWLEKEVKSVANITRADVREFLALAGEIGIRPEIEEYPLQDANRALLELKTRKIRGAKVLRIA